MIQKNIPENEILNALRSVIDPATGLDLVGANRISGLQVRGGDVLFLILIDPVQAGAMEAVRMQAEKTVAAIAGVKKVTAVLTAEREGPAPSMKKGPAPLREKLPIKHIIAVASGKGGVGKSTVAVNLAVALAMDGLKVGLMDADIYGPSVPMMLGLQNAPRPVVDADTKKLIPHVAHGVKAMSMGMLVDASSPMIWRGPMIQSAIRQFLEDVDWAGSDDELDVLVVDMPPGTGDAQLTLAQKVPLSGAVIVSTPQDIALIDARKGIAMFEKVGVKVLGLVENMSYFCCPGCNTRTDIFGHGGARAEAAKMNVPLLAEIPLQAEIRMLSDAGTPVVSARPDLAEAQSYRALARDVMASIALERQDDTRRVAG
ncbi:Mrp/NBP35 family ATP-binding protein [Micavibrio aeruginosavorus]|uniref:Mrp/NBP35 family ATP-binding protein n=1 Tax=Micavibrio aeruginosavorus TaxID=349221 RepID=UPI003F4AE68B